MDTGTLELQIFVSLVVILGTAFVALVCDYLKGNNERLREFNLELRVRKEEQEKHQPLEAVEWLQHLLGATRKSPVRLGGMRNIPRPQMVQQPVQPEAAGAPAPAPVASVPVKPVMPARVANASDSPSPAPAAFVAIKTAEPPPATEPVAAEPEFAERPRRNRKQATPANSLLDSLPKPAWLQKEHEEKASTQMAEPRQPVPVLQVSAEIAEEEELLAPPVMLAAPVTVPVPQVFQAPVQAEQKKDGSWTYRSLLDEIVAEQNCSQSPAAEPEEKQVEAESDSLDKWTELLQRNRTESQTESSFQRTPQQLPVPIPVSVSVDFEPDVEEIEEEAIPEELTALVETGPTAVLQPVPPPPITELELPIGFIEREVFTRLLLRNEVINAVVVSIGINDYSHHVERLGRSGLQSLQTAVEDSIKSLLNSVDMGCRTSDDEFILVFPNLSGADAQRRLNTISERLWGFQLRTLNSFSVMFSWGAVEVQAETMADAVASASERMYQTKRNRKTVNVDVGRSRRLAV